MDINKLFHCCKTGDLKKIKYLFEHKEIDPNIKDSFDSTPLYYACLCGHMDIVDYLLQNGAKCEMNTFQGERCLYGALTTSIKNLLRNYKIITPNCMRRDLYQEFLRKIWENHICVDMILRIKEEKILRSEKENNANDSLDDDFGDEPKRLKENKEIYYEYEAHQCILAARSWFFHNLFLKRDKVKRQMDGNLEYTQLNLASSYCLENLIRYLYTGELNLDFKDIDDMLDLTSKLHLDHLYKQLLYKKMLFSYQLDPSESCTNEKSRRRRRTLSSSQNDVVAEKISRKRKFKSTHNRPHVIVIDGESEIERLKVDLASLLKCSHTKQPSSTNPHFFDVNFMIGSERFRCHKVFFVGRSEYFRALLDDPFSENLLSSEPDSTVIRAGGDDDAFKKDGRKGEASVVPTFRLNHVTPKVFGHVVRYLYQDCAEIEPDTVFDVLQAADEFLLPGLKKICSNIIASNLDNENVVTILLTSRTYGLTNLEDTCAEYISNNLSQVAKREDFRDVIINDAAQVVDRQETDTISIIDDVRYYVTSYVQTFEAMKIAKEKLDTLDELLEELGLEA